MKATVVVSILLFTSSTLWAADRTPKVRELMEAQGLLAMVEQQMNSGKEQVRAQAKQMLDQIIAGMSPPPEFQARFRKASEDFVKSVDAPWTAQEIVDQWSIAYGAQFTDQELDALLLYYKSPLGKKDVLATQRAMPKITAYLADRSQPVIERATQQYISDLNSIIKECKCRK